MIITRTPLRLSFLGGGTDYSSWYSRHGGLVVGVALDKYSYVNARRLPPYHPYKTRLVYSDIETVKCNKDIKHRAFKATMEYLGANNVEIFHASDIPSRTGTGSSSSFLVGLVNALNSLDATHSLPQELADTALFIEQDMMGETVGLQDAYWAAFGGLNEIRFGQDGQTSVFPLAINVAASEDLRKHLMLFYTGISRTASEIVKGYAPSLADKHQEQMEMMSLARQGIDAIYNHEWHTLGYLIGKSWEIKHGLSPNVSNHRIDAALCAGVNKGAYGGKLIGAGGGGCIMFVAAPEIHSRIRQAMPDGFVEIEVGFDFDGSRVIYADRS